MNECWRCSTKTELKQCPVCGECLDSAKHDLKTCQARHTNHANKSGMIVLKKTSRKKLVQENLF